MLTLLLLLTAVAVVLVSAQGDGVPDIPPVLGCTTSSFQMPSWLVQDLQYSDSKLTFGLINRATNFSTTATCQPRDNTGNSTCAIQDPVQTNDVLVVTTHVDVDQVEVLVSESWTCNDRKDAITPTLQFGGLGYAKDPWNCTGLTATGLPIACHASRPSILIKATLFSPITASPPYIDGPKGHNSPTCTTVLGWTLSRISYLNQTGNGASTATYENFDMVIKNLATGYEASCVMRLSGNDLRCEASEFGTLTPDRYTVDTAATLDYQTFELSLTQTWYCDQDDPAKPVSVTAASGDITLPLSCETETTHDTISRNCRVAKNAPVPVNGTLVSVKPLPAYSIIDPIMYPDGCTASSILHPAWSINYFHIDTNTASNTSAIGFNIILSAPKFTFGFPLSITQGAEPVSEGSEWYPCVIGPFDPYEERRYPKECSLRYDPGRKELSIRADWECSDLDKNYPVQFSGISTSVVNSEMVSLVCNDAEGSVQCVTEDPAYTWVAPINDVTWKQET